jgi:diacylglycerol kinase (ATP)
MDDIFFIVNPRAASGRTAERWERRVGPLVEARFGSRARWACTTARGEAAAMAARERAAGTDLVVAVGGDGTISEIAAGLLSAPGVGSMPRLGIVPAGTCSDFARTFGLPRDPAGAVDLLSAGRTAWVDACEMTGALAGASRSFAINICGCGIPGDVVRRVNTSARTRRGAPGFLSAALATLVRYRPCEVTVSVDGGPARGTRLLALFVCNGRYFGGGMQPGRGAEPDDGLLRVVEVSAMPRVRVLAQLHRLYSGRLEGVDGVRVFDARQVEVCGPPEVLLEADGEQPGTLPARFTVIPRALRLVVQA